jgi:hypothetical protein
VFSNKPLTPLQVRTLCALPELEGLVKFYGAFYTQEEGRISIALEYMNGARSSTPTEHIGARPGEYTRQSRSQVRIVYQARAVLRSAPTGPHLQRCNVP